MRVVIVGGHLTPALAVIEGLVAEHEVVYIGRKNSLTGESSVSLEYETIRKMKIPFVELKMGKLQRFSTTASLKEVIKVPLGFSQALAALFKIKPDVVVSFGSYVSVPVGLTAKILGIPLVIHEQTQEAGLANRALAPFAKKICISHESSRRYFPKNKTILTGNPIRVSVSSAHTAKLSSFKEELPLLFITGGSQGSHVLNEKILPIIAKLNKDFNIVHQTGDSRFKDYERLNEESKKIPEPDRYKIVRFLSPQEFGSVLSASSLVVARAGANTVNEILFLEKPALLMPLSFAQKEEQLKNATQLSNLGLAEIVGENIGHQEFLKIIQKMVQNLSKYKLNQKIERKNSTDAIIKVLKNAANKN